MEYASRRGAFLISWFVATVQPQPLAKGAKTISQINYSRCSGYLEKNRVNNVTYPPT